MFPSLQLMAQRRTEPANRPQHAHGPHSRKASHHLILVVAHGGGQHDLDKGQRPVVLVLVDEDVIQDVDGEGGHDARDAPLRVQGADDDDGRQEGVEQLGPGDGHEPGEGVEGRDDGEQGGHEEDGGDAAEGDFFLRGERRPCFGLG